MQLLSRTKPPIKNVEEPENFNPPRYIVSTVFTAVPGLKDELKAAKTPDEIKATLDKYTPADIQLHQAFGDREKCRQKGH